MNISNETVNFITDTFDEIVTHYYNFQNGLNLENVTETTDIKIKVNYLEALRNVLNSYMDDNEIEVREENQKEVDEKIQALDDYFNTHTVNSEELRKAFLLLNIKGFKEVNFSLDLITPDAVGILVVHLIDALSRQAKDVSIIDPNCGTGNLLMLINNFLPQEAKLIGVENHETLATLFNAEANFMEMECSIYLQDALQDVFNDQDILVTDVASYEYDNKDYHSFLYDQGIKYFPYLLIEKYLTTPDPISKQIYIIDNDFFEQVGSKEFKLFLKDKAVIKSLIALPSSMFVQENYTRGILIIETINDSNKNKKTGIYMLPSFNDHEKLNKVLTEIKKDLNN